MKKNKKIIIISIVLLLIVIGIISFLIINNSNSSNSTNSTEIEYIKKEKITPFVYKVTKAGSDNVMYLFGSIHAANVNDYEFPDYFNKAYKEVDYVTCEYDSTNSSNLSSDISKFVYSDQTTIKDHISEESYNKITSFFEEKGYNINLFERFKMSIIFSLVENIVIEDAGLSATDGIDNYMINKAKKDGKEVLEVESEEFQTNLLTNISDKVYELSVIEAIDNYDKTVEDMKKEIEAWKSGNEMELDLLSNETSEEDLKKYSKEELELMLDFNNKLLFERNITMTEKFEEYFNENKKTMFMVGSAHIVGDFGIVKKLQDKGYIVEKLS